MLNFGGVSYSFRIGLGTLNHDRARQFAVRLPFPSALLTVLSSEASRFRDRETSFHSNGMEASDRKDTPELFTGKWLLAVVVVVVVVVVVAVVVVVVVVVVGGGGGGAVNNCFPQKRLPEDTSKICKNTISCIS